MNRSGDGRRIWSRAKPIWKTYVRSAPLTRPRERRCPFVTIELGEETIVGSTRFANIDPVNRKAEMRLDLDQPRVATNGDQHRSETSDAHAHAFRRMELRSC